MRAHAVPARVCSGGGCFRMPALPRGAPARAGPLHLRARRFVHAKQRLSRALALCSARQGGAAVRARQPAACDYPPVRPQAEPGDCIHIVQTTRARARTQTRTHELALLPLVKRKVLCVGDVVIRPGQPRLSRLFVILWIIWSHRLIWIYEYDVSCSTRWPVPPV